ncbi:MAG TPA: molybdopterin-binding protein [Clostridiaceae bacterium]
MEIVPVEQALGMVLCHDLTQIIPNEFKGVAFKKGHIIKEEDIPRLLDIGKKSIYVWEMKEGILHENDAAKRIAKGAMGDKIILTQPSEGKVNLVAGCIGVLKINYKALECINMIDEAMFATLHTDILVAEGDIIGGTRVIPLFIDEYKIKQIEDICKEEGPIVWVLPLKSMKVGIITTGSEVYDGRIVDKFGPIIEEKVKGIGSEVIKQIFVTDSVDMIADAVRELLIDGAEMILVTGGMSVDPDDVTPKGIKEAGAKIISYGAPVLPGSMFLMSYIGDIPVMGLPGCIMYSKRTVLDLILPKVAANEKITKMDIIKLGHGGMCLNCEICSFPRCSFGKW